MTPRCLLLVLCSLASIEALTLASKTRHTFGDYYEQPQRQSNSTLEDLLGSLDFKSETVQDLRTSIVAALSPGWPRINQKKGSAELAQFFEELDKVRGTLFCLWDETLNAGHHLLRHKRVFIAANFKDNEEVLPHLIVHIWHFIALLTEGNAFVSIYESSSTDKTGFWLDKLQELCAALQVPYRVKKEGALAHRGTALRGRIELLSRVRNAALEPLWDDEGLLAQFERQGFRRTPKLIRGWHATDIIFTNDVFACARDMLRLLYHDADVACGTDFHQTEQLDRYLLYDVWVARDMTGTRAHGDPPYVNDPYSADRLRAGLPIPMKSCWNGLVSLKAAPFIFEGLKFRTSRPGECLSSECKLMNDDLIKMGHTNIVMDPSVRLAYHLHDATKMYDRTWVREMNLTTYGEARRNPIDVLKAAHSDLTACCMPLEDESNVKDTVDAELEWGDASERMKPEFQAKDAQHVFYKEIHPPTGVSHCCQAHFTQAATKQTGALPNLIVVRQTLLQIYQPRRSAHDEEECWLELAAEYRLAGNVESLAVLHSRVPGIQRDAILLTFRDAKLAVLDWDELDGRIFSSSLHSWEQDVSQNQGGTSSSPRGPQILADPQGRCAAVLLGDNRLALLPSAGAASLELGAEAGGLVQPSSLASSYSLNLSKLGIKEARGSCFLHRYNEPVLLILHEASPTWPGLYTERKDTRCLTAFSLNLGHQKHLRLWHAADLPSDADKLIPVPLGGCIVLCQSLILYHSQGVSCALAVSSKAYAGVVPPFMDINPMREAPSATAARHAAKFATNIEPEAAATASKGAPRAEGFELDLVDACSVWLTPSTMLLALAEGRLVLLTLELSGGIVRKLKVQKANEAPRASCCCRLGPSLFFLGSWTADSLLLHAGSHSPKKPLQLEAPKKAVLALPAPGEEAAATKQAEDTKDEPEHDEKAEEANGTFNVKVGATTASDDEEEFTASAAEEAAVNGRGEPQAKRRRLNTGSTGPAGQNKDSADDEFDSLFSSVETARLSTVSLGAAKFTFRALDKLFGLGPITSMISVDGPLPHDSSSTPHKCRHLVACTGHAKSGGLTVLTRSIVPEVITTVPLPGVKGLWAVKFRPEGLPWEPEFAYHAFLILTVGRETKILETGDDLSELKAEQVGFVMDRPTILAANILSMARIVQVCSNKVVFLAGSSKLSEMSVAEVLAPPQAPTGVQGEKAAEASRPDMLAGTVIMAASIADPYILLHLSNGSAALLHASHQSGKLEVVRAAREVLHEVPAADVSSHITSCTLYQDHTAWLASHCDVEAPAFCVVCNARGLLQIFALPSMELVFDHAPVTEGSATLSGDPIAEASIEKGAKEEDGQGDGDPDLFTARPIVVEVCMQSFSSSKETENHGDWKEEETKEQAPCERPVLVMLLSDGGMLAYQAFLSPVGLKFVRLELDWVGHADGRGSHGLSHRITRFQGMGDKSNSYSGLYISGERPLWLVASRGGFVPHPAHPTGRVTAMTPFNIQSCPQGFITADQRAGGGSLSIAMLPEKMRLDTAWPCFRHPLRLTPHTITHLPNHNLYCITDTRSAPYQKRLPEEEGGDLQATYTYAAAEAGAKERVHEDIVQVQLLQPKALEPLWHYDLMPAESARCVEYMALLNCQTGQNKMLLVVGTSLSYGEDYPCTGRVLLFDVEQSGNDGKAASDLGSSLLYQREFQGPVTAVSGVEGLMLVAWGCRLESHRWTGRRLETTAFHDASVMITSMSTIKRFVALGDIHKSVSFFRFAPDNRAFESLSKDFGNCDVLASKFLVKHPKLFVLVADAAQNLRLLTYNMDHPLSWSGTRMIPLGAFHSGHEVGGIVNVKVQAEGAQNPPLGAYVHSLDSSMAYVLPLWQDDLQPVLLALQQLLHLKVPQPAGLNPRAYRERFRRISKAMGGGEHWRQDVSSDTFLEADILVEFQYLAHQQQMSLASKMGIERSAIFSLLDSIAHAAPSI